MQLVSELNYQIPGDFPFFIPKVYTGKVTSATASPIDPGICVVDLLINALLGRPSSTYHFAIAADDFSPSRRVEF